MDQRSNNRNNWVLYIGTCNCVSWAPILIAIISLLTRRSQCINSARLSRDKLSQAKEIIVNHRVSKANISITLTANSSISMRPCVVSFSTNCGLPWPANKACSISPVIPRAIRAVRIVSTSTLLKPTPIHLEMMVGNTVLILFVIMMKYTCSGGSSMVFSIAFAITALAVWKSSTMTTRFPLPATDRWSCNNEYHCSTFKVVFIGRIQKASPLSI